MMPFNMDDPLGIGLRARAADYKDQFNRAAEDNARAHGQLVSFGHIGPLSDPAWDGFFEAMRENGVKKMGQDMGGQFGPLPSTYDPKFQSTAIPQFSSHISAPLGGFESAMNSVRPLDDSDPFSVKKSTSAGAGRKFQTVAGQKNGPAVR